MNEILPIQKKVLDNLLHITLLVEDTTPTTNKESAEVVTAEKDTAEVAADIAKKSAEVFTAERAVAEIAAEIDKKEPEYRLWWTRHWKRGVWQRTL